MNQEFGFVPLAKLQRHIAHLVALRALGGDVGVGVKFIAEAAEEQDTGGLEQWIPGAADLLRADAIIVMDAGNFARGIPTLTTTLRGFASVTVSRFPIAS